ncbi:MAG: hypothetical protein CMP91_07465 [Gammaproteobacteria bacterium]|nr:hypothetical protein [Gammaproteobacteria bacterium]MAY03122.1 hypothetical protein [Gammaproteobacteria bacterium]|tara:strand:+ start:112509 stop:113306 length:798 start_codon:yes stop_codon:yes gene_type:complete
MKNLVSVRLQLISACLFAFSSSMLMAQLPQDEPDLRSAMEMAPVDLTGTWVSVIAEDWRYRMVTPPAGELHGLPLNQLAQDVMNAWDPDADEAAGLACKGYAAPNLMRLPGRARISWENDSSLKIEYDNGEQTRLLHFDETPAADTERSWQGHSIAEWVRAETFARGIGFFGVGGGLGDITGPLQITTTRLREGYLRKNGVPFSENAVLTEYIVWRRDTETGDEWFSLVSAVDDPQYLRGLYIRSSEFRKEADDSMWSPRPCSAR